jgi:hypothetical protein
MAAKILLPPPVLPVREGLNEPRIDVIPTKSAAREKYLKKSVSRGRFAPSSRGASIGPGPGANSIAGRCCSQATG